jgi:hypothetical protein
MTRRIIAVLFAICGAGVMSFLSIKGEEVAFTALISVVSIIIGFYFGTQANKL